MHKLLFVSVAVSALASVTAMAQNASGGPADGGKDGITSNDNGTNGDANRATNNGPGSTANTTDNDANTNGTNSTANAKPRNPS